MSDLTAPMAAILRRLPDIVDDPRRNPDMALEEARARTRRLWTGYWNAGPPWIARIDEHIAEGPHGPIAIRRYDPDAECDDCIIYYHGGGFVLGDLDTHDGIARRLALFSGLQVFSIAYRLAPENPYPLPLDDCVAAAHWVHARTGKARFGLAGDSAGANLALATALRLRDGQHAQATALFLIFGCYDRAMTSTSYAKYGRGGYLISNADIDWFWRQYLGQLDDAPPTLAASIDADLRDLPITYVGAAECDPLCGDSERLFSRLHALDQAHTFRLWCGLTHACVGMSRDLNAADQILAEAAVWLRHRLRREVEQNRRL
jgi:acetyl esterase